MAATPCRGTNKEGKPCGAPVVRGTEWCAWHTLTPDEQLDFQEKGRRRSAQVKRERAVARQPNAVRKIGDDALLSKVVVTLLKMLYARLPGTSEPNYATAGFACWIFALMFRTDPAEMARQLVILNPELDASRLSNLDLLRQYLLGMEGITWSVDSFPPGVISEREIKSLLGAGYEPKRLQLISPRGKEPYPSASLTPQWN